MSAPVPIKVRANFCPTCYKHLNGACAGPGQAAARGLQPGDFTICSGCGQMLRFGPGLIVRFCTPADLQQLTPVQRVDFTTAAKRIAGLRLN